MPDNHAEINRVTNTIVKELGSMDLQSALTVVSNLAGQLVAVLSEGRPSAIRPHVEDMTENIYQKAIAKLVHDDLERRKNASL